MRFHVKLDFLMNITKTTNASLAHYLGLDASYISRLRNGKRMIPKDISIINNIASYIAHRCSDEPQQKTIADAIKIPQKPFEVGFVEGELTAWLLNENQNSRERVESFLRGLAGIRGRDAGALSGNKGSVQPEVSGELVSLYYGIEGKRQAVEDFLSTVAGRTKTGTLLLCSDEETSWMTADPTFAHRWAALMTQVLANGNRIKIIHTISRDLDEMLSAISQWMPLYMSGLIEPYYYPKKRDGIFRNTLFIAPDTAAVVSHSVSTHIKTAANIIFRDKNAVSSFSEEFMQYLNLCRPLMKIYTERDSDNSSEMLMNFEEARADTLIKTESLSLITMPKDLLCRILKRYNKEKNNIADIHSTRQGNLKKMIQNNLFTEIIVLPHIQSLKNGTVKVAMSDMLGGGAIYYTKEEYTEHIYNIIKLLETEENFRVQLIKRPEEDSYMVYARDDVGVIVAKTSQPPVLLHMKEPNMTAAFWDFLTNIIGERAYDSYDRGSTISRLYAFIELIRE